METYFLTEYDEGFQILYGNPKIPEKAYVIGMAYNKADADIFLEAILAKGTGVSSQEDFEEFMMSREEEEIIEVEQIDDLVDELERGFGYERYDG
jgi:hypothetical protein